MPNKFIISILIILASIVNAYATSIVGTWKLSSFEMRSPHKQSLTCDSPTGLLTYTATGYVAVGFNCMRADGLKKPSYKLDQMTFYTGKYSIENNIVTHIIQNASSPDYYNKKLIRKIDLLTDNKLVLSLTQNDIQVIVGWDRVG